MQNWTEYWDNIYKPEVFGANYDVYSLYLWEISSHYHGFQNTIYLWINSFSLSWNLILF